MATFWSVSLCSLCILFVVKARPQQKRHRGPTLYDDVQDDFNSYRHKNFVHVESEGNPKYPQMRMRESKSQEDISERRVQVSDHIHVLQLNDSRSKVHIQTEDTNNKNQDINSINLVDTSQRLHSENAEDSRENLSEELTTESAQKDDELSKSHSKWSPLMQKYINEIYGGQLPYGGRKIVFTKDDYSDDGQTENKTISKQEEEKIKTSTLSSATKHFDEVITAKPAFHISLDDVRPIEDDDDLGRLEDADDKNEFDGPDVHKNITVDETKEEDESENNKVIIPNGMDLQDRKPKQQYESDLETKNIDSDEKSKIVDDMDSLELMHVKMESTKGVNNMGSTEQSPIQVSKVIELDQEDNLDQLYAQMEKDTQTPTTKRDSLDDLHSLIKKDSVDDFKNDDKDSVDEMFSQMNSNTQRNAKRTSNSTPASVTITKAVRIANGPRNLFTQRPELKIIQEASNYGSSEVPILMKKTLQDAINTHRVDDLADSRSDKSNATKADSANRNTNRGDKSGIKVRNIENEGINLLGVDGNMEETMQSKSGNEKHEKIESVVKLMDSKRGSKQKLRLKSKTRFRTRTNRGIVPQVKAKPNLTKNTTASFSTQPNPPTTKPTKVTPTTKDKSGNSKYIISKPHETCRGNGWCPPGRMCHEGICVCGDQGYCVKHRKPVCGNDNVLYPSHCELHRTACVTKKHIRIDYEAKCRINQQPTTSVAVSKTTTVATSTILGSLCEFVVRHATAGILWGQKVMNAQVNSFDECRDVCETAHNGCMGFEYSESEKYCGLYDNMDDVIFWPNSKMTFYEKYRCKDPEPEVSTCGYEMVKLTSDPVYGMCHMTVHLLPDFQKCVAECQGCKAFTYKTFGGVCEIFYNQLCVDMLNKQGSVHYIRHCHGEGKSCRILEVIPGRSPYMCSKATSSVANLIECHDTCVRGHCQAFRYKNDGSDFCEIFFDKSCIPMLEKGKDNYYVRRCANPEDCKYEEVESSGAAPCEIVSSNTDTFEKCRESCTSCVAFKYLYDSGECSLYQQTSCITKKNINYIKRDCHQPEIEATTTSVNHVIAMAPTPEHLSVKKELKDSDVDQAQAIVKGGQGKQTTTTIPTVEPNSHQAVQQNSGMDHLEVLEGGAKDLQDPDAKEVKKDGRTVALDVKVDQVPDVLYGEGGQKEEDSMYEKMCTLQEYNRMKGDILRYHCVKLGEAHCGDTQIPKKSYIATLMFSFYDRNMDESIQKDELWEIWLMENFDKMFSSCTLLDLFKFENIKDNTIYKDDFLDIFDIPAAAMQEEIQVITTLATVGNGLEIRCGLQPSSDVSHIVWRRHGVDLMEITFPGLAVFSDGTLYLESVDIHNIGNWTCHDRDKPGVKQVHILDVHVPPIVSVAPSTQLFPEDNSDIYIHCHADGIPRPTLEWEVNGHKLPDQKDHFIRTHNNGSLIIYQSNYQTDTGTYKCTGKNAAGKAEDLATVYIQKPNQTDIVNFHKSRQESFFIFHKNGFTVYEPSGCYVKRHVKENFGNLLHMPEELDSAPALCPGVGKCRWGQSVNVIGKFVYVSQPYQNRVVVVDAKNTLNPVEFILTDHYPSKIYYVEHLDEVWVLCWNSEQSTGSKTIIVIREASKDIRHHIVHTQPIGYRFDLVQNLFLPPANTLNYNYHYGYVLHTGQKGLFKLELDSMRYTKAVDLTAFDCIPQNVAFVPIGGSVIVNCLQHPSQSEQVTVQILLDYITDTPLGNLTLYGTPYVTPDSRNVVTVDKITGDVRVAEVLKNGNIKKAFDVTIGSSISDVTFLPSELGPGYDAFLTSAESPEVFSVNLSNGKVTTIKDVDDPRQLRVSPFSAATRSIISGDVFSEFVASPGKSSLIIFNGKHNDIHCQFYNLLDPDSVVYSVSRSR